MRRRSTIGYHLKVTLAMNRLVFRHDNLRRMLPDVLASDHLRLDGVFTHFASADEPESPVFNTQRERFDRAYELVSEFLPAEAGSREQSQSVASAFRRKIIKHACNSAALLRDSRVWYDPCGKPSSYGIVPLDASTISLQPVMSLTRRWWRSRSSTARESGRWVSCGIAADSAVIPPGSRWPRHRLCRRGTNDQSPAGNHRGAVRWT